MRTVAGAIATALLAVLFAPTMAGPPPAKSGSVEITYVANEGFLIASGSSKVLIDALFSEGFGRYLTPSLSTSRKLTNASSPFDGVDVILVTHAHDDHFDPGMVVTHLTHNPGAICLAPQQAVDKMVEKKGFEAVASRVQVTTPEPGQAVDRSIGDIDIRIFGIPHAVYMENGVNRHRNVQNVGYVISVGGITVCHTGDAVFDFDHAYIEATGIDEKHIDVLFIEYFDMGEGTQHLVKDVFKPKHVIAMHIPPSEVGKMAEKFPSVYPGGVVFEKSMDKKTVTIVRDMQGVEIEN
ncbi:MAG: MBL fold metallo-hydrolase [Candidatus Latescibacterota bacterium]|nr:MAG: MBL fold metallo-hydrolase [Candidatus Latescibacterota bacterium]